MHNGVPQARQKTLSTCGTEFAHSPACGGLTWDSFPAAQLDLRTVLVQPFPRGGSVPLLDWHPKVLHCTHQAEPRRRLCGKHTHGVRK